VVLDPIVIGLLVVIGFVALILLGLPVSYAMLLTGTVGFSLIKTAEAAWMVMVGDIFLNFSSYTLSVAPLFALMGFVATYTEVGSSLFNFANKCIGHFRGGLAMATQVACAAFGAINGSIAATIGTMSAVAYPEMKKLGYGAKLSAVSIASGSNLSGMIPPSLTLIIYGAATETSIGRLFMGGIGGGILMMLLNIIAVWYVAKRHPELAPTALRSTWKERLQSARKGGILEIAIIFCLSVGGLFAGWFTATEAGAVGAAGMMILGIVKRKFRFKQLRLSLYDSTRLACNTYILLAAAAVFGRFFAVSKIPQMLANWVGGLDVPHIAVIFVILGIFFLLGMIVDLLCVVLVTIPVFFPMITAMGYDPIWWGIIILCILATGALTPPVGLCIFLTKAMIQDPSVKMTEMFAGVWPFVTAYLVGIVILFLCPQIVLWLPNHLFG
jgi:tripartite ATP-independent transporter DctM subunit